MGDSLICPRGTVRLAEVLAAQPGAELDQVAARNRLEHGILTCTYAAAQAQVPSQG